MVKSLDESSNDVIINNWNINKMINLLDVAVIYDDVIPIC